MCGFTTTLTGTTFERALAKTIAALKAEGFGVLSDIDVQHAMKEKLGVVASAAAHRPAADSALVHLLETHGDQ